MQSKILGRTGLEVPIVSFGTAFLARVMGADGHFLPGVDEDVGVENVVAAIEGGCTLVDTAPLYGNTASEKIIGRALRERPDLAEKCTVTTKVGRSGSEYDFSFDGVMQQVEDSQERLGLDAFDVLYIHDPMDFPMQQVMAKDGALGALRKLQDEGVVRFVGIAANDPDSNGPYIDTGEFDASVVPDAWSLLNRAADTFIFPGLKNTMWGLRSQHLWNAVCWRRDPCPGILM